MLKRWMTALILFAWQVSAMAADGAGVVHELSFPAKNSQYVHVRSTFSAGTDLVDLHLPSWAPGSYLIRDFATNLERFEARGPDGASLDSTKVSKNHWRIEARGAPQVTVDYDVWAGRRNVSESWIEADFALLIGVGMFL